jgi:hypothetical protein
MATADPTTTLQLQLYPAASGHLWRKRLTPKTNWVNHNCNNSVQSAKFAAFEESQESDSDDTSSSAEMDISHDTLNRHNVPQDSHPRPPETEHELNNNGNMETIGVDIPANNLIGDTHVANNNSPDETLLQEYEEYILESARNDVDSYTPKEKFK